MTENRASITNNGAIYGTFAAQLLYLHEMSTWYIPTFNRSITVHSAGVDGQGKPTDVTWQYRPNVNKCVDQGLQSYLVFTGALDRLFADAYGAGKVVGGISFLFDETGPVRILGLGKAHMCAEFGPATNTSGGKPAFVQYTDRGRVVNTLGVVAPVVHQWDRRCTATLQNEWLLGSGNATSAALARYNRDYKHWEAVLEKDAPPDPVFCNNTA